MAYIRTMGNGGWTDRVARNQVDKPHRKEQILSYVLPAKTMGSVLRNNCNNPRPIVPSPLESHVAFIADNPFPFHNSFKIKRLRFWIIGEAQSPIIGHNVQASPRNNCNNSLRATPGCAAGGAASVDGALRAPRLCRLFASYHWACQTKRRRRTPTSRDTNRKLLFATDREEQRECEITHVVKNPQNRFLTELR